MTSRRVLHVVDRVDGGVPKAVRVYIENSPDGFIHEILSPFSGSSPAEVWRDLGVRHHDLGQGLLRRINKVGSVVASTGPDVIHAHSSFPGVYARVRRFRVPVVYEPHCFKHDDPSISGLRKAVFRTIEALLAKRTAKFGVLTSHEASLVLSLRTQTDCVLIPNLPTIKPSSSRRSQLQDEQMPVVAMSGRIAPQKDPEFFISVAASLKTLGIRPRMVWIGDGSPRDREKLEGHGIEVTGWLNASGVAGLLGETSVYVHTAAYEGFPLSVLDAAAIGVPIVAREIPAFDHTNFHRAPDAPSVARLVQELLTNETERQLAQQANDTLLSQMNPVSLRRALSELYDVKGLAHESA